MVSNRHETETISTATVTATGTEKAVLQQPFVNPSEQVISQIQNKITGSSQEIQITLSPAELGSVRVTFRQQEGQIEGLLEVENPQVRKDIEKAMPQIAAILAQNGMLVRRIDIAPMPNQQQNNQESLQSPEHHFNPSEHQFLTDQGHQSPSRGSETRIQQEIQSQTDMLKIQDQTVYDLSGLNMYA
jgi:flagellar hook-length control protein FliK